MESQVFVSYVSINEEYTLTLIQNTWALTEKYDQAIIHLQADATENDSNPLNIKSESWQMLEKQGMINVDFKIDVVETDCFVIPTEGTMRSII